MISSSVPVAHVAREKLPDFRAGYILRGYEVETFAASPSFVFVNYASNP